MVRLTLCTLVIYCFSTDTCPPHATSSFPFVRYWKYAVPKHFFSRPLPGTIVSIDLDPREVISATSSTGYRVVHLVYPPTRVVIFIQSAYDAGLHIPPFHRGEIAVGVETRTFEVKGLHNKLYAFKRAQLPLQPGHLSSVYRAQVKL